MLDFDRGSPTKEELLEMQQKWQYDSYVYSSQNHMKPKVKSSGKIEPACDRLRVLIPLLEPITNEFDRAAFEQAVIKHYTRDGEVMIDKTFMGKTRYFAHGTTDVSNYVDNRGGMN
jgi:hypothetical protein|tara:strand:+ start:138 stop:485 length:348 start_codon:yes stop_codon:yes gene_type:complete